jgi:hypothetical protein
MLINIKGIKGEGGTGYEPSVVNGKNMGHFDCDNCHFFKAGTCGHPEMIARAKKAGVELKDGRRPVDPEGCCEFVDRVGRSTEFNVKTATWLK